MQTLPHGASAEARKAHYAAVSLSIDGLLDGEDDWVAAMATVATELHHAFEAFHWTGFYRLVEPELLIVGPYQGGHGCLRIPVGTGVCGTVAANRRTELVPDVHAFPGHIACSSTTQSEIVVPVLTPDGRLLAVLDVDSDHPAAFDALDQTYLEAIAAKLGAAFG
jgi:GAF domain-containing protein